MPLVRLLHLRLKLMFLQGAWPWVRAVAMVKKYGMQTKNALFLSLFGIPLLLLSLVLLRGYDFPISIEASNWTHFKMALWIVMGVSGLACMSIFPLSVWNSYHLTQKSDDGMREHATKIEEVKHCLLEKAYLDSKLKKASRTTRMRTKRL